MLVFTCDSPMQATQQDIDHYESILREGHAYLDQNEIARARDCYERSLSFQTDLYGREDVRSLNTIVFLADVLFIEDDIASAAALYKETQRGFLTSGMSTQDPYMRRLQESIEMCLEINSIL